ncbi:hypothetical protein Lal_00047087 [Lupinus albus]|uniref:Putative Late embryogenesis abundant protein, LEA5-type n=1 Tax=Lupinus albus TaxID=3870 RepID=A0A6A5N017_LUPAL|nr:putative Late embryogenesis abundant protein, LEA5-type [Lupinus albus]KAF1878419.1 hypothetical protein Lal_00047087 [Lupinus albus]
MARSFSNVKLFSVPLLDGFSHFLVRRGYAATTTQSARIGGTTYVSGKISPKTVDEKVKNGVVSENVSWVPDPITGYYKPQNIKEIDVAEFRASLVNKKFNH